MAAPTHLFTIERVAEMLGDDADWLADIATDMEPERGCLSVYGPGDQWFYAFTPEGVAYLQHLVSLYKEDPEPRARYPRK